ncbi:MAG: bifunctional glutamate N-acetyltransferase/amino-acid acetyltransferase ArgJ [Phycisphaerales bacterium]|nr:bifunctional glutamate N-acetyltransferase/amino-acid acetyltransferase ArgJ [Phycisphaerales bacterium]
MSITRPLGFRAAATTAGLKPSGKPDLALITCDPTTPASLGAHGHAIERRHSAAAVFTRNVVVGAPVEIGRRWRASQGKGGRALRALLVNAGCSNAATGQPGIDDAIATMQAVASGLRCTPDEVLPSSTGIIGHRLPVDKINAAVPALVQALARGEMADDAAAAAIMTTDLVPKAAHREFELERHHVHLGAIGKGSGMIAPQLDSAGNVVPHATMLAFITTDAAVEQPCLQAALEEACRESFDRVSVDAHPSCSDTVVLMASGAAPVRMIHRDDPEYFAFKAALTAICQDLARQVVRDGEGATRIFRVEVRGANTHDEAVRIARAVVDSPLVKCAIHGKDPNWGRIVTAAGNAGVRFDTADASLAIGGVEVYRGGVPTGVARNDPKIVAAMSLDLVQCALTVGRGPGTGWMLGCDLSDKYVRINADYTT